MPAPPIAHPDDTALADYVLGKLADPDDAAVDDHLSHCPACQARAAELDPADTLASLVAAAGTRPDTRAAADATPPEFAATLDWAGSPPPAPAGVPPGLAGHPRYRLVRQLGEGGMGVVWLAEPTVMKRPVALKVIHPAALARPGAVERFRREVRAAAGLHHPHVATAFDADEAGGTHFLVMEYVPGETLLEAVRRGPLPVAEACRAVRDAALGLAHAHAAGLVHRDVKPGNLIRAADGTVKLLDFGLVGVGAGGVGLTGANVTMGTPDYIAPEQATDAAAADARSDVYALGCTLYHLLAGKVPYPDRSVLKKLDAHRDAAARPAPIPGLPPGLAAVLDRITATDPAARYPTAGSVAEALEPFCAAAAPAARRARPRWVRVAVGLALLAVATVVAVAVYTVRRGTEEVRIETDDPDIEVVMRRNGDLVRIVDTKTNQKWELDAKQFRLTPDGGELAVDLPEKGSLVLRRNGAAVVTIRRGPTPAAAPAAVPPAVQPAVSAVEELHRIPFLFAGGHDFAADGSEFLVYTAVNGKRVAVIFDAATGKETGRFPLPPNEFVYTWFIPGSRELLVSADLKVGRYDRATGAKRADLFEIPAACSVQPLSPAGDALAVHVWNGAGGPGRHRVVVYDLRTGAERFRVDSLRPGSILGQSPQFSPDGKHLVTTDTTAAASAIRVWDAAGGKLLRTIDLAGSLGSGIGYTADGREVVAAYTVDNRVTLAGRWDAATGEKRGAARLDPGGPYVHSGIHPGGRLATYHVEGGAAVRYLAIDTGRVAGEFRPAGGVRSGAGSYDGRLAVYVTDNDLRVVRMPVPPAATIPPAAAADPDLVQTLVGHTGTVRTVAYSPDGKYVLSASGWPFSDQTVRLWDVATGKAVWVAAQGVAICSVAFCPKDRVVVGGFDGTVRLLDVKTGEPVRSFQYDRTVTVNAVAPSPDGRLLMAGGEQGVWIWDVKSGEERPGFGQKVRGVVSAAFSPDGGRAVAGSPDGTVRVWDVKTGQELKMFQGKPHLIGHTISWTPDGRTVVFGHAETVILWEWESGRVSRLVPPKESGGVLAVAVSPDGKRILTGGMMDRTVRLWDIESGTLLQAFRGHTDTIWGVAFSPDGRYGVSCSGDRISPGHAPGIGDDRTVRLWRLPAPVPR